MKRVTHLILILMVSGMVNSCHDLKTRADLIIFNANIYSSDTLSLSGNSALVVSGGKILEIGSDNYIRSRYWAPENIDAGHRYVYPGFIDAHSHFTGLALNQRYADLTAVQSKEELVKAVTVFSDQHSEGWIIGRGWDQNNWPGKEFPDNIELNKLFPNRPVLLYRVDGHAVLANEAAIKAAKLPSRIPQGEAKYKDKVLTGIFLENTADLLKAAIPPPSKDQKAEMLARAARLCHEAGLTGVTDAGLDKEDIQFLDSLLDNGFLKIRIDAWVTASPANLDFYFMNGPVNKPFLRVGAIKLYADGALGSRGACLLQPYSDDPSAKGILVTPPARMEEICRSAFRHNFQVNTHAIGDSAVRAVLRIYAGVLKSANDNRWRIEHSQVVNPADMHFYGDFSIIPSIQGGHATDDSPWAETRLGPKRIKHAYAYKDLLNQNKWLPNGTDFPVIGISPVHTFYASVFRRKPVAGNEEPFLPDNALKRDEALKSITIWAAKSCFEEKRRGSILPGKLADLVILDTDLMKDTEDKILTASVQYTIVNGEVVYRKK